MLDDQYLHPMHVRVIIMRMESQAAVNAATLTLVGFECEQRGRCAIISW